MVLYGGGIWKAGVGDLCGDKMFYDRDGDFVEIVVDLVENMVWVKAVVMIQ